HVCQSADPSSGKQRAHLHRLHLRLGAIVVLKAALLLLLLAGCAPARPVAVPKTVLTQVSAHRPLTVLFFFSAHCPCQTAHDARILALEARYAPRGVTFV